MVGPRSDQPRDFSEVRDEFLDWLDDRQSRKMRWIAFMLVGGLAVIGVAVWAVWGR